MNLRGALAREFDPIRQRFEATPPCMVINAA